MQKNICTHLYVHYLFVHLFLSIFIKICFAILDFIFHSFPFPYCFQRNKKVASSVAYIYMYNQAFSLSCFQLTKKNLSDIQGWHSRPSDSQTRTSSMDNETVFFFALGLNGFILKGEEASRITVKAHHNQKSHPLPNHFISQFKTRPSGLSAS